MHPYPLEGWLGEEVSCGPYPERRLGDNFGASAEETVSHGPYLRGIDSWAVGPWSGVRVQGMTRGTCKKGVTHGPHLADALCGQLTRNCGSGNRCLMGRTSSAMVHRNCVRASAMVHRKCVRGVEWGAGQRDASWPARSEGLSVGPENAMTGILGLWVGIRKPWVLTTLDILIQELAKPRPPCLCERTRDKFQIPKRACLNIFQNPKERAEHSRRLVGTMQPKLGEKWKIAAKPVDK